MKAIDASAFDETTNNEKSTTTTTNHQCYITCPWFPEHLLLVNLSLSKDIEGWLIHLNICSIRLELLCNNNNNNMYLTMIPTQGCLRGRRWRKGQAGLVLRCLLSSIGSWKGEKESNQGILSQVIEEWPERLIQQLCCYKPHMNFHTFTILHSA